MREPENIKELVKLKPDYIGLIFYPKSKRFVDDADARKILARIPDKVKKVGVFVNEVQSEVIRIKYLFNLDFIQLHGSETPEYCSDFEEIDIPVIKAFGIDDDFNFESLSQYEENCSYFLFDTKSEKHGGTGIKFNWSVLKKYKGNKPVFLSGGINGEDAAQIRALKMDNIFAVDVNSRFETEPGLKDIGLLSDFIKEIRE